MKINNLFFLATAALLFANCTHQELDVSFHTGTAVAVMETDDTKSNVDDQGYFTWTAGDQITIHAKGANYVGNLASGADSPNGTFSYNYTGTPEFTGYAMYPHSENHNITEDTLVFHMPATYELGVVTSNTNAPMLARPTGRTEATASYNFSHLGGVIRVVFNNAPVGTDKFTLSLGESVINGNFEVNLTAAVPTVATSDDVENGSTMTTLKFDALESVQNITLFVPVPTGNYTGIEAKLYAGDQVLGTWGNAEAVNNIGRRALVLMAPITFANAEGNIEVNHQVSSAGELATAVAKGGLITLTEDIIVTEAILVNKNVTVNLNGKKLTGNVSGGRIFRLNTDNVEFTMNATDSEVAFGNDTYGIVEILKDVDGTNVTINGGVFEGTTNEGALVRVRISNNNLITLNDVTYTDNCAVTTPGNYANSYVVSSGDGNGTETSGNKLVVNGGTYNGSCGFGLSEFESEFKNVKITAKALAVECAAGTLNIDNCDITVNPGAVAYTAPGTCVAATSEGVVSITNSTITAADTDNVYALAVYNTGGVINVDAETTITGRTEVWSLDLGVTTGEINYSVSTSEDLVKAVANGGTITLSDNIVLDDILTIDKPITLNGNGKTLTSTAGRAINVSGANGVTIKDLTIKASGERAVNIIQNSTNVTIVNVKATAANYAVNVASSAPNAVVNIDESELTGLNVVNISSSGSNITINNTLLICNDQNATENYGVLSLNKDATGSTIIATDVTFDIKGDSKQVNNCADESTVSINGQVCPQHAVAIITYPGAYYYSFETLAGAVEYAKAGDQITLISDITLTESLLISADKDIILNLNGKTVECETSDVFVVTKGTLTLNGNGLVYGSRNNSSSACAVWAKEDGNVVINGGTYKVGHDSASKDKNSKNWRNDCIYARGNAKITINGGVFEYTGEVDPSNPESDGNKFLLNCYDDDYKAGKTSIEVKGGKFLKFNPAANTAEGPNTNFVPNGYKSVNNGDYYTVSAE